MPLRSMLTPAQQQAAEQRFADRNTSRVSRGLDPRTRGPFDAPPTQVQKDAPKRMRTVFHAVWTQD